MAIVDAAKRHAFCKAEPWIALAIHAHRENDVAQTLMVSHIYSRISLCINVSYWGLEIGAECTKKKAPRSDPRRFTYTLFIG